MEFKAMVVQACLQPDVSMAAVALSHGLNANLVRSWVTQAERHVADQRPGAVMCDSVEARQDLPPRGFVPLALPTPVTDIRIELQRGATVVKVIWPSSTAAECVTWLRELLQ